MKHSKETQTLSWFYVMDTHSGGRKSDYEIFYVRAETEGEAEQKFERETGLDPHHVTCDCCGSDFSVGGPYESFEKCSEFFDKFHYPSKIIE